MAPFIMEVRAVSHELTQHLEKWISQGESWNLGRQPQLPLLSAVQNMLPLCFILSRASVSKDDRIWAAGKRQRNKWRVVLFIGNMESGVWRMKVWETLICKQHPLPVTCTFLGELGEIYSLFFFQSFLLLTFVKDGPGWLPLTPCPW